jgi:hypothetical protein
MTISLLCNVKGFLYSKNDLFLGKKAEISNLTEEFSNLSQQFKQIILAKKNNNN